MVIASETLKLFKIEGAVDSIAPLGFGHINDSYSVEIGGHSYLLQRLNTRVFLEPRVVESNLSRLLEHSPELFPQHVKGPNGQYHQSDGENTWRVQEFVADSYSPIELTIDELREIAKGYGRYTAQFTSEKTDQYLEAIQGFHDLHFRLKQFEEAVKTNKANRMDLSSLEIEQIKGFAWIASEFDQMVQNGLPQRVCHNDAKAGNCLLSKKTGDFLKIVDLDTVGPGYVLFDLGDILRSMLFNIPENHADLNDLVYDASRTETILESFLQECGDLLSQMEKETLTFGGLYMTYIMAVRFLTDYLNGDIYYKISYPEENLIRTRNQLKILQLMHAAF
ncbi:phosphotransferase enzyme family protein [Roseivirga sp.]|uniref:phosphotransferase enzyme family protein n=1 Tax=Roseivirga sp. TaxID=1964215 RepID=UPI003B520020